MKQIKIGYMLLTINYIAFELKPEVKEWLIKHNVKYTLTNSCLYDKLDPVLEFEDDVPDEIINWFALRWL
jgi:hypothetical protein